MDEDATPRTRTYLAKNWVSVFYGWMNMWVVVGVHGTSHVALCIYLHLLAWNGGGSKAMIKPEAPAQQGFHSAQFQARCRTYYSAAGSLIPSKWLASKGRVAWLCS